MKHPFLFSFLLLSVSATAQDSAQVIFYRPSRFAGNAVPYYILHRSIEIAMMRPGAVAKYKTVAGQQTFVGRIGGERSVTVNLKKSQTLYLECGVTMDGTVGFPAFRRVPADEARPELRKLDPAVAATIRLVEDSVSLLPQLVSVRTIAKKDTFRFKAVSVAHLDSLAREAQGRNHEYPAGESAAMEENRALLDTVISDFRRFTYSGYRLRLKNNAGGDKKYLVVRYWKCIQTDKGNRLAVYISPTTMFGNVTYNEITTTEFQLHVFLINTITGMLMEYKIFDEKSKGMIDPDIKLVGRMFEKSERLVKRVLYQSQEK